MKILMVSPVPTDPVDAGNRARIATLAGALGQAGHELHFAFAPMESGDTAAMQARFGPGRFHELPWQPQRSAGRMMERALRRAARAAGLESGWLRTLDDWYDPRVTVTLRALQATHRFDAVFVEYVFFSRAFEAFDDGCLRVLDTHDTFGLRHRHYLEAGLEPQWFSTTLAEEEAGFRRADVVLAIQPLEAEAFAARLAGTRTRVLEVGHLIEIGAPVEPAAQPSAVFVGSSNAINVVGVRFFVQQVLPLVRQAEPHFVLKLAGTVCEHVAAEPVAGVQSLGFVDDLRQAFGAAMLAINPVQAGTGVNIKLLDAMAAGMPVVTSKSGARGVPSHLLGGLFVVDDSNARAFADAVLGLVRDRRGRLELGRKASSAAAYWNARQLSTLHGLLLRQDTGPAPWLATA